MFPSFFVMEDETFLDFFQLDGTCLRDYIDVRFPRKRDWIRGLHEGPQHSPDLSPFLGVI